MALLRSFSEGLLESLRKLGAMTWFLVEILRRCPAALTRPRLVIRQISDSGVLSLVIIMTSGFFVGMVLGLQLFDSLSRLGQENVLGAGVALTLLKELGPVVAALLFAGRAGTALASEIGLMGATDQLSAMEVMAVDPLQRVVVPRFLGGLIALPLLTTVFNAIGILGAWFIGVYIKGVNNGQFWSQMQEFVEPSDVWEGVWKSVAFGVTASLIAVFEGYHTPPTAEGVGMATTHTVVTTSIAVLILDYLITAYLL